jgi:hypothetical protein
LGTNYYVVRDHCEHCHRCDKEYHIGKSSYGWSFSFRGYRNEGLDSWKNWKNFLKDEVIMDEYGDIIPYEKFVEMIETYKSPNYIREDGRKNLQHNQEGKSSVHRWFSDEYDWDDDDGYAFSAREFS